MRVDNYPVSRRQFVWDTYSAEALFALPWTSSIFRHEIFWGLRGGVQKHSFPFLYIAEDDSLVQARNELVNGSVGFFAETAGRWQYHLSMRYQQPLTSSTSEGNSFTVNPFSPSMDCSALRTA